MKIINTSKRLLCFQTNEGRVEVLPGVVTNDKRLDSLKGDKIFDHYLKEEILKEVKGGKKAEAASGEKKTEKELLVEKAEGLGIDIAGKTKNQLKTAIHEAENGGGN